MAVCQNLSRHLLMKTMTMQLMQLKPWEPLTFIFLTKNVRFENVSEFM